MQCENEMTEEKDIINIKQRESIIEDILANSELATKLVPDKFKFTSKQGRARRHKLLMGAKKLSETSPVSDISLADVCKEAGIPRASAYHFFPNVEAIFLALRFIHAIEILDALQTVDVFNYNDWQDFITAIINKAVDVFEQDKTKAKLIYDANTPDFEGEGFGSRRDGQVIRLVYDNLAKKYQLTDFELIEINLLVAFSIVQGVFTVSYRRNGCITEDYVKEAITASIAYLSCFFPQKLPNKTP